MSEVHANIVVEPIDLVVNAENNQINVTPTDIQLNVYTAGMGTSGAGGNVGELQFNYNGGLGGAANTFVNANGNVTFTNLGNLKINGGSIGQFLQTDGSGNLVWAPGTANVSGNGTAAGANGQVQLTDGTGNFRVVAGLSYDSNLNILTVPGNVFATRFVGTLANGTSNIAMALDGNITLTSNGNIAAVVANNRVIANNLAVDSSNITLGTSAGSNSQATNAIAIGWQAGKDLQGSNAIAIGYNSGSNAQAYETIAIGTDAGKDSQGNSAIAIGYLAGGKNLSGQGQAAVALGPSAGEKDQGEYSVAIGYRAGKNQTPNNSIIINAANANLDASIANAFYVKPLRQNGTGNVMYYNVGTGEISYDIKPPTTEISNGASNVSIPIFNGNINLTTNGNTTLIVTETGINVAGTLNATGNANVANITATVGTFTNVSGNGSQLSSITGANVTGIVANATYASNANFATSATTANRAGTVTTGAQPNITSVGNLTSLTVNSTYIALGNTAGYQLRGGESVSIGNLAGFTRMPATAVGIGTNAIRYRDAAGAGMGAVAVGAYAGYTNIGNNAIAIGANAGYANLADHTIVLNATGANLNQSTANTFTVKPIRPDSSGNLLFYNDITGEITYGTSSSSGGNAAGNTGEIQFNSANVLSTSPDFKYDTSTNTLLVDNLTTGNYVAANINFGTLNVSNSATITGNLTVEQDDSLGNPHQVQIVGGQGYVGGESLYASKFIKVEPRTVANLPAFPSIGYRAMVTNSNTATFNSIVGAGGSNIVPVFFNGTNWRVG